MLSQSSTTPTVLLALLAAAPTMAVERGNVRGNVVTTTDAAGGSINRAADPKRHRYLSNNGKPKKTRKPKTKKTKKPKKTKAPTQAPTPTPTSGLQDGYEFGMKPEIEGFWVGDEKFSSPDCVGPFDYCSSAIFDPRGPTVDGVVDPQNFLVFQSGFIGDTGTASCLADAGVDVLTGDVNSNWLRILDPFNYILQIEQKKCLSESECPYNIVEELPDRFGNYDVLEQSCGSHLKNDRLTGLKNCELFHVSLLQEKSTGEKVVANVLSYSGGVEGYGNVVCPSLPTFDLNTVQNDANMDGILLFVKQGCIDTSEDLSGCDLFATDNWECKFGSDDDDTPAPEDDDTPDIEDDDTAPSPEDDDTPAPEDDDTAAPEDDDTAPAPVAAPTFPPFAPEDDD